MSTPDGMGLATVGFNPPVARAMCADAGFVDFEQHDEFRDPANLYYEMRKPGPGARGLTAAPTSGGAPERRRCKVEVDLSQMPGPINCCAGGCSAGFALREALIGEAQRKPQRKQRGHGILAKYNVITRRALL